jgi:hypothetical protein
MPPPDARGLSSHCGDLKTFRKQVPDLEVVDLQVILQVCRKQHAAPALERGGNDETVPQEG